MKKNYLLIRSTPEGVCKTIFTLQTRDYCRDFRTFHDIQQQVMVAFVYLQYSNKRKLKNIQSILKGVNIIEMEMDLEKFKDRVFLEGDYCELCKLASNYLDYEFEDVAA